MTTTKSSTPENSTPKLVCNDEVELKMKLDWKFDIHHNFRILPPIKSLRRRDPDEIFYHFEKPRRKPCSDTPKE